jgi:uncharacterized protein
LRLLRNGVKNMAQVILPNRRAWAGEIPISSSYTAGTGGQIFFDALKSHGKLIATRCSNCSQVYLPARSFCERCFAELHEQVDVKPAGRLVSFTICHIDIDGKPLRKPAAFALVQLEGATTYLFHRLLGVSGPEGINIGTSVEVVIKPAERRAGSILDIEGFRLVQV